MAMLFAPLVYGRRKTAHPVLTKAELRHGHAFCTHTLPFALPFLLKWNLSPKDIVGGDNTKQKVSCHLQTLRPGKC